MDVVVARYNEDVSWIDDLPSEWNVVVYDKGAHSPGGCALPNVGREGHTYFHHILSSYDTLDPMGVTFFCQGGLNMHKPAVEEHITRGFDDALRHGFSESMARVPGPEVHPWHHAVYDFRIAEWPAGCLLKRNARDECFGRWFERHLRVPFPNPVKWVVAANFAARNDHILANSKEFYRVLLNELADGSNPETGHFMERSWYYVFGREAIEQRLGDQP